MSEEIGPITRFILTYGPTALLVVAVAAQLILYIAVGVFG